MSDGDGPRTVAVLASGSGTNFQALLDRFHGRDGSPVRIGLLVASRAGIGALDRARATDVPAVVTGEGRANGLSEILRDREPDLVVLAGWLKLVPSEVVRTFWGRMINIHPALLPSFGGEGMYGRRVHEAVLERGVRVTGVTVHFVDERYDRGPIIAQWPVPVREGDDPETLAARVLEVEHRVLPAVVEALARRRVRLGDEGRVLWREDWLQGDRFRIAPSRGEPALRAGRPE